MGTALAILLTLVASSILSAIFNFFGGLLGLGILNTTGIIWLPVAILVAMSGAGMFAGMVISLRLIKSADPGKTFFGVVVAVCLLAGMSIMVQLIQRDTHMFKDVLVSVLTLVAVLAGAKFGSAIARED